MKKLLSILITGIMIVSGTTMAFANDTNNATQAESKNVTPYALACDCGGSLMQRTTYTSWGQVGQVVCRHGIVGRS